MVTWRAVTPGYFAALGVPILRGRGFQEEDRDPHQNAIILSDSLARRMFPGEDPLGKQIRPGPFHDAPWLTVIGVAGNVKNSSLMERDDPEFYVVRKHSPEQFGRTATAILSGPVDPTALARWVRAEVATLDPTLPVNVETLDQRVGQLAQRPRFNAWLLGLFAGYGPVAFGHRPLWRDLVPGGAAHAGDRRAHGAGRHARQRSPGWCSVTPRAGPWPARRWSLIGSWFAARLLAAMLFHVSARDPWILAAAAGGTVRDRYARSLGALAARGARRSHAGAAAGVNRGTGHRLLRPVLSNTAGADHGKTIPGCSCYTLISPSRRLATCLTCSAAETKSCALCSADCFL